MAAQNCPGVLQVEMRYVSDGQSIYNVFHVSKPTLDHWPADQIATVLGYFEGTYWVAQRPLLCASIELLEIVATDLTDLAGLKRTRSINPAQAGTHTGINLPNSVTFAVKLQIGIRGRGVAGRIFWPTIPSDEVAIDTVDSTYAAAVAAAVVGLADVLRDDIAGFSRSVLSRYANRILRPTGIARDISSVDASNPFVDSQKNRLPQHKRHKKQPLVP
jgi:hypothetical protein